MNISPGSPCTVCMDSKLSIISIQCRICYENDKNETLIAPCNCKGTVAFVHRSCLERWLAESNTTMCELCHVVFRTERFPKYTSRQSIWNWLKSYRTPGGFARGVRSDIIACTVITPVAIIITYACLFSSEYYNQKKFVFLPAARWTSISLLIMIALMLMGYYLWVYSVIRMHSRMWYNWWQRDCVVRYIPSSNMEICCQTPPEVANPNNTPASDDNTPVSGNDTPVSEDTTSTSENKTSTSNTLTIEIIDENVQKNEVKCELKIAETNTENYHEVLAENHTEQAGENDTEKSAEDNVDKLLLIDNNTKKPTENDAEKSTANDPEKPTENPIDPSVLIIEMSQDEGVAQGQSKEAQVEII